VISALGVREGLLYSMLDAEGAGGSLIAAAQELNVCARARLRMAEVLTWTDASWPRRMRRPPRAAAAHAPVSGDIGWRAHPTSREQSLNIIATRPLSHDHPGRAISRLRCSSAMSG